MREEKRQQTRSAIASAALSLALERGLPNVTIEAIAAKVSVSTRTVSNYFLSKEHAVVTGALADLRRVSEQLRERPLSEPPLEALLAVLVGFASAQSDATLRLLRGQAQLVLGTPQLLPFEAQQFAELERELRPVIAERLGASREDDASVWLTAAAAVCGVRLTAALWLADTARGEDLVDCLERSFRSIAEQLSTRESELPTSTGEPVTSTIANGRQDPPPDGLNGALATRRIRLAYGRDGMEVELPAGTTVVEHAYAPGAPDQAGEVRRALRQPVAGPSLRDRLIAGGANRSSTVAISICDGTRAQPRKVMIPVVLDEIEDLVDLGRVTLLVATGTHRGNTDAELEEMLGEDVLSRVRVVNHDARDPESLVWCGQAGNGVPVWLNRIWVEADFTITTGFVEPHFFAGFSGGPKMIAPGLAGLETVLVLHDARRIGHPCATWGVTVGNPVHDDVRAVAAATGAATYSVDVVMNRDHQIVQAFGGDLLAMHAAACDRARTLAMVEVDGHFDVVVTTNSGYPLDQNLYQAVKGMSAGAMVVKPGGQLLAVAECSDGFPDHGSYVEVLTGADSPQALLAQIEDRASTVPDQWQVQIQAKIQSLARVSVRCEGLTEAQLARAHLGTARDVAEFVGHALAAAGPGACCCVLPEGPQTIPYVRGSGT